MRKMLCKIFFFAMCIISSGSLQSRYGQKVDIDEYPYVLSIVTKDVGHICSASIISENWALTAAHCFNESEPQYIYFRAGSVFKTDIGTLHRGEEIIFHYLYNNMSLDYDFALVLINGSFPIDSRSVQAVVPTSVEPSSGKMTTVLGWDETDDRFISKRLKTAYMTIMDSITCDETLGTGVITESMICATSTVKDICEEDPGGPLIDKVTNEQVGIVSWGDGCTDLKHPAVFSNVAVVRNWISDVTGV